MAEAVGRISLRERRALGLTLRNCARVASELKANGEWTDDRKTNAQNIVAQLVDEAPESFVDADRDWASFFEALVAFLEKLMPLIEIFMSFM